MTAYLWETVLQKDSFLDILQKFISYQKEVKKTTLPDGKIRTDTTEKIIFPRYHQLDVVRKLVHHTREHGPGHNYLIQHSAGSGKSNSIAWLAYRLSGLHNEQNEKIFHSVIIVTADFHMPRALLLAEKFIPDFIEVIPAPAKSPTDEKTWVGSELEQTVRGEFRGMYYCSDIKGGYGWWSVDRVFGREKKEKKRGNA